MEPWEETKSGADLIAAERKRQVEQEGWTPEHDDRHPQGELVKAANNYGIFAARQVNETEDEYLHIGMPGHDSEAGYYGWPWEASWWKPSEDPVRNLVKAGALIAAEIDRLQRAAASREGVGHERDDD